MSKTHLGALCFLCLSAGACNAELDEVRPQSSARALHEITQTAASCITAVTPLWQPTAITPVTGTFVATFDVTPLQDGTDAVVAFSLGRPSTWTDLAAIVRFNSQGRVDVMDGALPYTALTTFAYNINTTYRIRMRINVSGKVYSVWITPPGGSEVALATNYHFRNEQASRHDLDHLDYWAIGIDAGSLQVCGLTVSPLDRFGIRQLYPTLAPGKYWLSTWDNGTSRSFDWTSPADPDDPWFDPNHSADGPSYHTEGTGVLDIGAGSGFSEVSPRMYVHDPAGGQWRNVEITMYFMRRSDNNTAFAGMVSVARTNHGTTGPELTQICDTRGIGARMRNDGHVDFEKETRHPDNQTHSDTAVSGWGTGLPAQQWLGFKYVVYDNAAGNVVQKLYLDTTDGINGGTWNLLISLVDDGAVYGNVPCASGIDPMLKLTAAPTRPGSESGQPNTTVYFRSDGVRASGLSYKRGRGREMVAPD
jgi:hypothetical protein